MRGDQVRPRDRIRGPKSLRAFALVFFELISLNVEAARRPMVNKRAIDNQARLANFGQLCVFGNKVPTKNINVAAASRCNMRSTHNQARLANFARQRAFGGREAQLNVVESLCVFGNKARFITKNVMHSSVAQYPNQDLDSEIPAQTVLDLSTLLEEIRNRTLDLIPELLRCISLDDAVKDISYGLQKFLYNTEYGAEHLRMVSDGKPLSYLDRWWWHLEAGEILVRHGKEERELYALCRDITNMDNRFFEENPPLDETGWETDLYETVESISPLLNMEFNKQKSWTADYEAGMAEDARSQAEQTCGHNFTAQNAFNKDATPGGLDKIARSTNMSREPLNDVLHDEFVGAPDDNLIMQSKVLSGESFNHD